MGGVVAAAAGAAAAHTVTKVIAAVALITTIGGGIAAVTGSLPDPIQSWFADLVDGIGIELPRPPADLPDVSVTLPADVTLPTLPQVTGTPDHPSIASPAVTPSTGRRSLG